MASFCSGKTIQNSIFWTSLLLLTVSVFLNIIAIAVPNWTAARVGDDELVHGLFDCGSCPASFSHSTYSCIRAYTCEADPDSDDCNKFTSLDNSRWLVFALEICSLAWSLLLIERMVTIKLAETPFSKNYMRFLLYSLPLFKLIEIASFIGANKVKFGSACNLDKDVCGEVGTLLMILVGIISVLIAILFTFYLKNCETDLIKENYLGLDLRKYLYNVIPLMILGAFCIFISSTKDWLSFEEAGEYKGDLMMFKDYKGRSADYVCYSEPSCRGNEDSSSDYRDCEAMGKIWDAAKTYLSLLVISLFFFIKWLEGVVNLFRMKNYGFVFLNFSWPVLYVVCHLSAIVSWFLLSKASYAADCKVYAGDDDIDFCAEHGITFSLMSFVCFTFGVCYYEALLYRNYQHQKSAKVAPGINPGKKIVLDSPKKPKKIQEDNTTFDTLQDSELHAAEHNAKKSDPFTFRGKKSGPSTQQTGSEMSILGDNGGKKVCKSCKRL